MQAHTITIAFDSKDELHRVRNFAEDLFYHFRGTRLATVENMDSAIDRVYVHVISSGRVKAVTKIIRECIMTHGFNGHCQIIDEPQSKPSTGGV